MIQTLLEVASDPAYQIAWAVGIVYGIVALAVLYKVVGG